MNLKITARRAYLSERKNQGNRLTVGFTGIADLRSFIGQEYIEGIMAACADYDINFINMGAVIKYSLFDDMNFISHYMKNFQFMKTPLIDGMVTWASSLCLYMKDEDVQKIFTDLKPLPMVDIGRLDIPGTSAIRSDNSISIHQIIEHLVNVHGYKNMIYVGYEGASPNKTREEIFFQELKHYNLKALPVPSYFSKNTSLAEIAKVVDRMMQDYDLREKREVDAIVTSTDILATAIIDELYRRGISVPADVAITGFNNWYDGITARTPVTTVNLEYYTRGYAAVEQLIDQIMNPDMPLIVSCVPTTLVVRQSCGCFEESVLRSGQRMLLEKHEYPVNANESEDVLRTDLVKYSQEIFKNLNDEKIQELVNAILLDIYEERKPYELVAWFQKIIQDARDTKNFDSDLFQIQISKLRTLVMPVLGDNFATATRMENIFHQMRALLTEYLKYESLVSRENPYRMNNISQIAISFDAAENLPQVFEVLSYQLSEMEISSAVIALSEKMSYSFPDTSIQFMYPEVDKRLSGLIPQKVISPYQFPKQFLPQDKRYDLMLEVLYHADRYFGYAFFEMNNLNIAVYDVIRLLFGNALYSVYTREGRFESGFSGKTAGLLEALVRSQNETLPQEKKNRLTISIITDYLVENIGEKTDLNKMSEKMHVSKSYLIKKCKEFTGHSIQELHELLKIEQAKKMLLQNTHTLAEISDTLGFSNQNYFSNVFKKNTGSSPTNWIRSNVK